uniref:NADH-ubiquinone oxidoreductase chain 4L n=1 Tax=Myosotella myosotis TaxID=252580 RepID=B3DFF2_9EUPU|nr:NADH dehydrogenase subunit 4L [Myosotella myosotis]ACE62839.1 NADH dehydrogenase subunit 4L [Myosotella myosotis]
MTVPLVVALTLLVLFFFTYMKVQAQVLSSLIILEGAMLSILLFYLYISMEYSNSSHIFLLVVCLGACEAASGLSLMVSMVSLSGSDTVKAIPWRGW